VTIPNPEREPPENAKPDICDSIGSDELTDDINKVIGSLNLELN
jgi:hypothetical protein